MDKTSECYWPEAAGDRLPNICKNGFGSTPTHYGNSQLLKADVWTNVCGETAPGRAKVTEYVRRIEESSTCPGMTSLFRSNHLGFPSDSLRFIRPMDQFRKAPSLQGLHFH